MAFFKLRKGSDDGQGAPTPAQSVESIRQRAKYRLAGATVLVLLGVIGFPLLFDKQPRPIAVDTPIDIPDKAKVMPLVMPVAPAQPATSSASAAGGIAAAPVVVTESTPPPKAESKSEQVQIATLPASPPTPTPKATTAPTKAAVKAGASQEAARVQALLNGKEVAPAKAIDASAAKEAAAGDGRFVVQVGAFADNAHAQEVRLKLERSGLKTYTQIAQTKDGSRIRVRVGPFPVKADAEKAAEKIKKLNLPAALLTL